MGLHSLTPSFLKGGGRIELTKNPKKGEDRKIGVGYRGCPKKGGGDFGG